MCNRNQCAEHGGVVQQTIQASKFLVYGVRQIKKILFRCALKIHRINCGLGVACGFDGVVNLFQVAYCLIQQDDTGAIVRTAFCNSSTDAVAGTGYQDDAVFKELIFGLPVAGYMHR